jgi:glycosyltransferase involved in cell wall biosynthesis
MKERNEGWPKVSTIIPVYNGEKYLAEAIKSVLSQTYRSIEVIVVDDGSTDRSADIAKSFNDSIRYTYQPNLGTAAAFNRGIKMARGEFFSFLGADDLWSKDKTQIQMEAFETQDHLDIVSGSVKQFFSPDADENVRENIIISDRLIPGHVIPAMLIRRRSFFRVGLFETEWVVGAEMSWYLRAKEIGLQVKILADLVLLRRIHKNNKGLTRRQFISQRAEVLKASLDRRRKMKITRSELNGKEKDGKSR